MVAFDDRDDLSHSIRQLDRFDRPSHDPLHGPFLLELAREGLETGARRRHLREETVVVVEKGGRVAQDVVPDDPRDAVRLHVEEIAGRAVRVDDAMLAIDDDQSFVELREDRFELGEPRLREQVPVALERELLVQADHLERARASLAANFELEMDAAIDLDVKYRAVAASERGVEIAAATGAVMAHLQCRPRQAVPDTESQELDLAECLSASLQVVAQQAVLELPKAIFGLRFAFPGIAPARFVGVVNDCFANHSGYFLPSLNRPPTPWARGVRPVSV